MSACLIRNKFGRSITIKNLSSAPQLIPARPMATTKEKKKELRNHIKSKTSTLTEDQLGEQSGKIQELIQALPQYQNAKRLSIYLSMPKGELRTDGLVRHALESGKKVFVPYISGSGKSSTMDMLRLHSQEEFDGLERDSWGIPTLPAASIAGRENAAGGTGLAEIEELEALYGPEAQQEGRTELPGREEEGSLDLIVMPGVAFDHGLSRLGHGGGFYDGFLTRFCGDGTRKPFLGWLCRARTLLYRPCMLTLSTSGPLSCGAASSHGPGSADYQ